MASTILFEDTIVPQEINGTPYKMVARYAPGGSYGGNDPSSTKTFKGSKEKFDLLKGWVETILANPAPYKELFSSRPKHKYLTPCSVLALMAVETGTNNWNPNLADGLLYAYPPDPDSGRVYNPRIASVAFCIGPFQMLRDTAEQNGSRNVYNYADEIIGAINFHNTLLYSSEKVTGGTPELDYVGRDFTLLTAAMAYNAGPYLRGSGGKVLNRPADFWAENDAKEYSRRYEGCFNQLSQKYYHVRAIKRDKFIAAYNLSAD